MALYGPQMTAEQAEQQYILDRDTDYKGMTPEDVERMKERTPDVPFGFMNAQWNKLKGRMQPGDYFQKFSTGDESFKQMAGRAGYALVRNGKGLYAMVTRYN